jgi:hypothetical protein
MPDRCDRCARPIATDADWWHEPGCECERCLAICWASGVCDTNGWRKLAEALELENARLVELLREVAPELRAGLTKAGFALADEIEKELPA